VAAPSKFASTLPKNDLVLLIGKRSATERQLFSIGYLFCSAAAFAGGELTGLTLGHLQQRDEHWAIVNLYVLHDGYSVG